MKKLFGMIAIVLLFSSVVFAEIDLIERDTIGYSRDGSSNAFTIRTICVDGYKFVHTRDTGNNANSISMVQFYENQNGNAVPAKC